MQYLISNIFAPKLSSKNSHLGNGKKSILNLWPKCFILVCWVTYLCVIYMLQVAGVVGRADLLCALCFIISFIMYSSAIRKGKQNVITQFTNVLYFSFQFKINLLLINLQKSLCGLKANLHILKLTQINRKLT